MRKSIKHETIDKVFHTHTNFLQLFGDEFYLIEVSTDKYPQPIDVILPINNNPILYFDKNFSETTHIHPKLYHSYMIGSFHYTVVGEKGNVIGKKNGWNYIVSEGDHLYGKATDDKYYFIYPNGDVLKEH